MSLVTTEQTKVQQVVDPKNIFGGLLSLSFSPFLDQPIGIIWCDQSNNEMQVDPPNNEIHVCFSY